MGLLMDLIAGDARDILLAVNIDDWAGFSDASRFAAHLSLGSRLDCEWLNFFSNAARDACGSDLPGDFDDACCPLESPAADGAATFGDRTLERVDPRWVEQVALLPDALLDRIAARWIDLIDRHACEVEPDDKPVLRSMAGDLVEFCRRARYARDVLLAWGF